MAKVTHLFAKGVKVPHFKLRFNEFIGFRRSCSYKKISSKLKKKNLGVQITFKVIKKNAINDIFIVLISCI